MNDWVQVILTAIVTVTASSGFWAYMQHKDATRTQTDRLLQGIAYDKIVSMGLAYVERGWITQDEYEDYRRYLYDPYKALGGNGVTERVMAEVTNLPLKSRAKYVEILWEAKSRSPINEKRNDDSRDIDTSLSIALGV
jgi:hypothetical protein